MARMAGVSRVAFTTTQLPSTSPMAPLATSSLTPLAPLAPTRLPTRAFSAEVPPIQERIQAMVDESKVVVFMKGVPEAPQCGFSNAVCQILRMHDVTFQGHNVLADEELRQGVKDFSNWPTIPQVYLEGEFIGGCDIMLQMHQSGELIEELGKAGIQSALLEKD